MSVKCKKATDIYINLSILSNTPIITLNCDSAPFFYSDKDIGVTNNMSAGSKIQTAFTQKQIFIPEKINILLFSCTGDLYRRARLKHYLKDLVFDPKCELIKWKLDQNLNTTSECFEIKLQNVNPYHFLSCIVSAVKDNSQKIGRKAILLDVDAILKIPKVSQHFQYANELTGNEI